MSGAAPDRRLTPATPRVALASIEGRVAAPRYAGGEPAAVAVPLADLCSGRDGGPGGPRDRQVLYGEALTVVERWQGHAFVQAAKDGYCGWVAAGALGPAVAATHRVAAAATHLYPAPDLRAPEAMALSLGARLAIVAEHARFCETADGYFVPRPHLAALDRPEPDPVAVAERLLGTPYLWGGNSRAGMDCSGLVQAAMTAAGIACPGDSDLQFASLGRLLPADAPARRGDLYFWKGHVAMAADGARLIHANGFHMAVAHEGIAAALARIEAAGEGPLLGIRRL